jgi:hypothetical protein
MIIEPTVRGVVSNMSRINQSDQDVDVEQKRHGDSSRMALTVSSVTTAWPASRGSNGIPLRVVWDRGRCKARRARSDTTSPMLRFCWRAMALAAMSTSSSMANVVRTSTLFQNISHQTSINRFGSGMQPP